MKLFKNPLLRFSRYWNFTNEVPAWLVRRLNGKPQVPHLPTGGWWCHILLRRVWKLLFTQLSCLGRTHRPPKQVYNGLERAGKGDSPGVYCDQDVGRVRASNSGRYLCVWTFPWAPKEGVQGFLVSFPRPGNRESPDIWLMTKMCSISFNWIWTCLVSQDGALWGLQPEASKRKVRVPSNTVFKEPVCSEKPNACLSHSQEWLKLQKCIGTVFGEVTYCGYRRCGNMCELDLYSGWLWHKRCRIFGSLFVGFFFNLKGGNIEQGPTARQWLRE